MRMTCAFRVALAAAALSAAAMAGGCAVLSYTVANLAPKPRVKALYELPEDQRALVFPDDVSGQLGYPPLRQLLADKVSAELMAHELADSTVSYDRLNTLAAQVGQRWHRMDETGMGVAEVTRAVGADLAVYLSIRQFQLKDNPADPAWKGKLTVLVKVVAADGQRLWPTDRTDGYELTVETPPTTGDSPTFGIALTNHLANLMAVEVVNLFRTHSAGE